MYSRGFSISNDRKRLAGSAELHARIIEKGPLTAHLPGFYSAVVKP